MTIALISGSPVAMEFIGYKNHRKNYIRPHILNPGAAHILFMSKVVDIVMLRMKAAGLTKLSSTGGLVFIGPTTRSLFVTNPDVFWTEFMDNGVIKKP
jgi:hypothetical protein